MLPIGTKAPDFKLRLDTGEYFRLRDLRGKSNVVLSFFPDNFAQNESREIYLFLQHLEKTQKFATVIAISPKNANELRQLLTLYSYNISIAADSSMEVCRNYRAVWLRGIAIRRITYVIDRKGIIRGHFSHQLLARQPWGQVMNILKELHNEQNDARDVQK